MQIYETAYLSEQIEPVIDGMVSFSLVKEALRSAKDRHNFTILKQKDLNL